MTPVPSFSSAATAAAAAVVASPLLAAWTTRLIDDARDPTWWRTARSGPARVALVAGAAAVLAAAATAGHPRSAWWLLATMGTVLALVDLRTHRLPARVMFCLAIAEAVDLAITAVVTKHWADLGRAGLAALSVGGGYLVLALAIPAAIGMGDIYLITLTTALLGWTSWRTALLGELALWLLAPVSLLVLAVVRNEQRHWRAGVPLGPAIIAGAVLACWL